MLLKDKRPVSAVCFIFLTLIEKATKAGFLWTAGVQCLGVSCQQGSSFEGCLCLSRLVWFGAGKVMLKFTKKLVLVGT